MSNAYIYDYDTRIFNEPYKRRQKKYLIILNTCKKQHRDTERVRREKKMDCQKIDVKKRMKS